MGYPNVTHFLNARLQLAAALIEADNCSQGDESIRLGLEAGGQPQPVDEAGAKHVDGLEEYCIVPSTPEPKYASQSCIFAPFRDGNVLSNAVADMLEEQIDRRRSRANSYASTFKASGGYVRTSDTIIRKTRPVSQASFNYLGVELPTEKKRNSLVADGSLPQLKRQPDGSYLPVPPLRQRAVSVCEAPRTKLNSPTSYISKQSIRSICSDQDRNMLDVTPPIPEEENDDDDEDEEDAIREWGVEKYLSTDVKSKLAAKQQRSRITSARSLPPPQKCLSMAESSPLFPNLEDASVENAPIRRRRHTTVHDRRVSKASPMLLEKIRRYRQGEDLKSEQPGRDIHEDSQGNVQDQVTKCADLSARIDGQMNESMIQPRETEPGMPEMGDCLKKRSSSYFRERSQRTMSSPAVIQQYVRTIPLAFQPPLANSSTTTSFQPSQVPSSPAKVQVNDGEVENGPPALYPSRDRIIQENRPSAVATLVFHKRRDADGRYPPRNLVLPQPLQGSAMEPRTRLATAEPLIYCSENFNGRTKELKEQFLDKLNSTQMGHNTAFSGKCSMACPPPGLAHKAHRKSTALYRNLLVRREEEMEGWGFEHKGAIQEDALVEKYRLEYCSGLKSQERDKKGKKIVWLQRLKEKKLLKARRKRKQARRDRRALREYAHENGVSSFALGVAELSPDEDADLSSTTSESESDESSSELSATEIETIVETARPAGQLFGKSLLDNVDEMKGAVKSKARYYGQHTVDAASEDATSDNVAELTHSNLRNLSINDTRKRMQATFGRDLIWEREVAKRNKEDGIETEGLLTRQNDDLASESEQVQKEATALEQWDSRSQDTAPTLDLNFCSSFMGTPKPKVPVMAACEQWLDTEDDSDGEDDTSLVVFERHDPHQSFNATSEAVTFDCDAADDDVPLAQTRKRFAMKARHDPLVRPEEDSEEDNVPLSSLAEQQRSRNAVQISSAREWSKDSDSGSTSTTRLSERGLEIDEDDKPLALTHPNHRQVHDALLNARQAKIFRRDVLRPNAVTSDEDDSDDDAPLGSAHPHAALVARQAAIIREMSASLAHQPSTLPSISSWAMTHAPPAMQLAPMLVQPFPMAGSTISGSGVGPSAQDQHNSVTASLYSCPHHASQVSLRQTPHRASAELAQLPSSPAAMPLMGPPGSILPAPRATSIKNWAAQVPQHADPVT